MRTILEEYGEFICIAIMCAGVIFGLSEILKFLHEGTFILGNYFVN